MALRRHTVTIWIVMCGYCRERLEVDVQHIQGVYCKSFVRHVLQAGFLFIAKPVALHSTGKK